VALGSGGTGYQVEVTHVWRWGNRLMIDARIDLSPPSLSISGTSPYHVVVLDTKGVDEVRVRNESPSTGFPLLAHHRIRCAGFVTPSALEEVTEVARPTWGAVKVLYR